MDGREMVRLTTFALAAALSIGNVLAAETPRVGEWGAVKYGFGALSVACPTTADISRYYQLRNSDAIAAETFSAQHCTTLDGGTEVMVEHDSAVWSGTMASGLAAQPIAFGFGVSRSKTRPMLTRKPPLRKSRMTTRPRL